MTREEVDTDSVAELNERVSELERGLEQATHVSWPTSYLQCTLCLLHRTLQLLQAKEIELQQLQESVTAASGQSGGNGGWL